MIKKSSAIDYRGVVSILFDTSYNVKETYYFNLITSREKSSKQKGSVKNFVALVKNSSFLVRITDMTILIEKEFIYGSSKRPNPTDYYRK